MHHAYEGCLPQDAEKGDLATDGVGYILLYPRIALSSNAAIPDLSLVKGKGWLAHIRFS